MKTGKKPKSNARRNKQLGTRGESFALGIFTDMGFHVVSTNEKPSLDAYLMAEDGETHLTISVQVKTGPSFVAQAKKPGSSGSLRINLVKSHVVDWQRSGQLVIVVWVDPTPEADRTLWKAYWAVASDAKGASIRMSQSSMLLPESKGEILRLARIHAGRHGVPLASQPLFPTRVADIKPQAWKYFSEWKRQGTNSPDFGPVAVGWRAWKHLTRTSRPQREVVHKLSLLPYARELLGQQGMPELRRRIRKANNTTYIFALCGRVESRYRARVAIDVIVEVVKPDRQTDRRRTEVKFLSVYEACGKQSMRRLERIGNSRTVARFLRRLRARKS
ncbi:MAG: DUF4365 domain-containing protein [Terracidiphilus sp.]